MKVLVFGASGMVGQGVLRECLLDAGVELVEVVGRSPLGRTDAKLREIVHRDMFDYSAVEPQLTGFDACFFCLGITSAGMSEADYRRVTYDLTLAAATTLARLNPQLTFVYVSGVGTDSTEKGRVMWARVKGATENAVMRLPFRAAYAFRPGLIQPMHGIRSRTALYQFFLSALGPVVALLRRLFPNSVLTTEDIGRAMLMVARSGAPKRVLEPRDIRALLDAVAR
jgi:uncharacterized protein YbjT (DUF2867 family)